MVVLRSKISLQVLFITSCTFFLSIHFSHAFSWHTRHSMMINPVAKYNPSIKVLPTSTDDLRRTLSTSSTLICASFNSEEESSATSVASSASADEMKFNARALATVLVGQGLLVPASLVASKLLQTPNGGFGIDFTVIDSNVWAIGALCTLPLFALAYFLDKIEHKYPALKQVTLATQRSVLGLLGRERRPLLAFGTAIALGLVAGVGEELLFRGVLQYELSSRFGAGIAVAISSIIFGGLHAVTPMYAFLATVASIYFGLLFEIGNNLGIAMVCHGVYDVFALFWAHWTVTGLEENEQNEIWDF